MQRVGKRCGPTNWLALTLSATCTVLQHTPVASDGTASFLRGHTWFRGLLLIRFFYFTMEPRVFGVRMWHHPHDQIPEPFEQSSLQGLGEEIARHQIGGEPPDVHVSFLNSIGNKKYLMLMCFVHLPLDALPFRSRSIALLLSW